MNLEELQKIAKAAAKNLKTEQDLNEFSAMLTKMSIEAALNAELDEHLGYDKHEKTTISNSRNGTTNKFLQTKDGQFELNTRRDRDGSFEPELVKKNQRRLTLMDDKILVRNALKFVPWKDYKAVTQDLKQIYRSATVPYSQVNPLRMRIVERFNRTVRHE